MDPKRLDYVALIFIVAVLIMMWLVLYGVANHIIPL